MVLHFYNIKVIFYIIFWTEDTKNLTTDLVKYGNFANAIFFFFFFFFFEIIVIKRKQNRCR